MVISLNAPPFKKHISHKNLTLSLTWSLLQSLRRSDGTSKACVVPSLTVLDQKEVFVSLDKFPFGKDGYPIYIETGE
jgi:hypothetical protein